MKFPKFVLRLKNRILRRSTQHEEEEQTTSFVAPFAPLFDPFAPLVDPFENTGWKEICDDWNIRIGILLDPFGMEPF